MHNIVVGMVDDELFFMKVELLNMKNNCDIVVLVTKDANPLICVEFSDDGSIFNGQTLLHIGDFGDLV